MSKTVDDAIRIRDNQRRSRARRKDLIKDLQVRVHEYELQGITATQDMQRAARKVAQENERLRTLLARHGILREEVDSFLRSFEQADGSAESEASRSPSVSYPYVSNPGPRLMQVSPLNQSFPKEISPRLSPMQIPRQPIQIARKSTQGGVSATKCGPQPGVTGKGNVKSATMSIPAESYKQAESSYASPSDTDSSPRPLQSTQSRSPQPQFHQPQSYQAPSYQPPSYQPQPYQPQPQPCQTYAERAPPLQSQGCCLPAKRQLPTVTEDPDCPSTADCFCPPTITAPMSAGGRLSIGSDEISCETAATIIAQMRGDGDDIAARASLGCKAGEVCGIKNTILMQIMDER